MAKEVYLPQYQNIFLTPRNNASSHLLYKHVFEFYNKKSGRSPYSQEKQKDQVMELNLHLISQLSTIKKDMTQP